MYQIILFHLLDRRKPCAPPGLVLREGSTMHFICEHLGSCPLNWMLYHLSGSRESTLAFMACFKKENEGLIQNFEKP